MKRVRLSFAAVAVLMCSLAAWLAAAQLSVDVGLVTVVATVLDGRGDYVTDLTQDDFLLYEDGELQTIEHFERSTDQPVSVGILLDTSGSMETKIDTATSAVESFLRQIHPDDEIFLITFNNRPRLVEDFTDDRIRLGRSLRNVRVGGDTALYDALALGLDHIRDGHHEKKAILLISDGEDTSSSRSLEQVRNDLRESKTLVYALGIAPELGTISGVGGVTTPPTFPGTGRSPFPGRTPPTFPSPGGQVPIGPRPGTTDVLDMAVLEDLARISGGRAWQVSGLSDTRRRSQIADALDEVADELRSQYDIGYYPGHSLDDGRWHRIEVLTQNDAYRVRSRGEYFGGADEE